jgi:pyridoxamine 5'-phosphate oxidase
MEHRRAGWRTYNERMDNAQPGRVGGAVAPDLRVDYGRGRLDEAEVSRDPIEQFAQWFGDAQTAGVPEANAMTLATADPSGAPAARVVLLKSFDWQGFSFYTNYDSRKGRDLAANPRAALCLFWQPLERQVRIEGSVERVGREESERYFHARPRQAQIGAWVSQQSRPITSRAELERLEAELQKRFGDGPVPLPEYWGGFRVVPHAIEFWQGRPSRLHDRLLYTRSDSGAWTIQRLSP